MDWIGRPDLEPTTLEAVMDWIGRPNLEPTTLKTYGNTLSAVTKDNDNIAVWW